ncbi:alpha/beta fold hydrolase [Phenylobacterium montanum]|uniref:Alpha/beta hydrolase n=1 Tax=Phenylobacterium montanum TaxID=2823693 RepID=A0A975FWL7_9CAUL|nr:alpha/beta hydrolase [Caulobacter sp. S6]QUD86202.1 alpha/beta hydrolase [Caulobacter sp. S6]
MNHALHSPAPNQRIVSGRPVELRPGRSVNLVVHEGDERADVTVFLCHGAGGNKNQWRNQWRLLTGLGYRVVAWDFAGHGETRSPRHAPHYAGAELVEDYLAIIERYGARRNILIGHSYGSRLTLCVLLALSAAGRLHKIDRVMLLGAPPPIRSMAAGPIATWPLPLLALIRPLLSRSFKRLAWHPSADPALVAYEERQARSNSLFMMKALMNQTAPLEASRLAELDLPILLLTGAADALTPPAGAEALARFLPQARLHVLEECGHQVMLEKPGETNALIRGFIGG